MTEVPNIPSPPQQPQRRWGRWLILGGGGCLLLLVLLVGFVGCLAIIGSSGGGDGGGKVGGGSASAPPQEEEDAAHGQYADQDIETFTRENYGLLVANPNEHKGARVDVTGQLLDNPEKRGNMVAFQMWADPVKVDWSTIVRTDEEALGLRTDDYVRVTGTVVGTIKGENAFGGRVSAVAIEADEVERVEAVEAVDPTLETVQVGQTKTSDGFSVTLQKLDFGPRHTRAYISARNEGDKGAKFDFYRSKITQGTDRAGQNDPYEYNMPKPKPGLQPGEETQGVVIFGKTDPSEPLQLSLAWDRGGYMSDRPEPLVFEVAP